MTLSCQGPLSTLAPAGRDAAEIATLFWWMASGALLIWLFMMALTLYAIKSPPLDRARTRRLVVGGGVVLPAVLLSILLVFGLAAVPRLLEPGSGRAPKIRIIGEQWWWRVLYELPDGRRFELANELRLPVNRRLNLTLESADVIHSFWLPSLAGKVDMLPGRVNRLSIEPTRTGEYLGVCAEYCGVSHAKMLFHAVVVEPQAFARWADHQTEPASADSQTLPGASLFLKHGCGACHSVRGTLADGVLGPDLTHVGSRRALGAGILANNEAGFREFLVSLKRLKPHAHMPQFDMLPDSELEQLVHYLDQLE